MGKHVRSAEQMLAELDDLLSGSGLSRCQSYVSVDDGMKITVFDCERSLDHAGRFHEAARDGLTLKWPQV